MEIRLIADFFLQFQIGCFQVHVFGFDGKQFLIDHLLKNPLPEIDLFGKGIGVFSKLLAQRLQPVLIGLTVILEQDLPSVDLGNHFLTVSKTADSKGNYKRDADDSQQQLE